MQQSRKRCELLTEDHFDRILGPYLFHPLWFSCDNYCDIFWIFAICCAADRSAAKHMQHTSVHTSVQVFAWWAHGPCNRWDRCRLQDSQEKKYQISFYSQSLSSFSNLIPKFLLEKSISHTHEESFLFGCLFSSSTNSFSKEMIMHYPYILLHLMWNTLDYNLFTLYSKAVIKNLKYAR